jgi:hypothetical protein
LPTSEAPTLAEVLLADEDDTKEVKHSNTNRNEESGNCSALQVDFMQAISQQLTQAQVSALKCGQKHHSLHVLHCTVLYLYI